MAPRTPGKDSDKKYTPGEAAIRGAQGELSIQEIIGIRLASEGAAKALEALGLKSDFVKSNITGLNDAIKNLNDLSENENKLLNALAKGLTAQVGPALKDITEIYKTAATNAQAFQVSLERSGQTKELQEGLKQQAFELAKLGIGYKDLKNALIGGEGKESTGGILEGFNAVVRVSKESTEAFDFNRKSIIELVAINNKFGVSLKDTLTVLNFTNDVMNLGVQGAQKFSDQLEKFASTTGQQSSKVFTDFNSTIERFAGMNADRAMAGFQKIQLTAQRAGIEVKTIMDGIQKFDDIEQGFQTGGQLNRVLSFLGGSFDTFKAIQADDDERAQMVLDSIMNVSGQFKELTTVQAKRNFAKQLAESTGGMYDFKTIFGLLEGSKDLSRDMMDIAKKPPVLEGFTDEERTRKIVAMTTSQEFKDARDALIEASKSAQMIAEGMRQGERARTAQIIPMYEAMDRGISAVLTGDRSKLSQTFETIRDGIKDALTKPAETFSAATDKLAKSQEKFIEDLRNVPIHSRALGTGRGGFVANKRSPLSQGSEIE